MENPNLVGFEIHNLDFKADFCNPNFKQGVFVVVTLSFNAKMDLVFLACNLKTRDSQKWPRKR